MSFPHPKAGCCIVPDHSHQQQQRSHHPEKHCILKACSNLGVCHSLIQRWDVALSMLIRQQQCHHSGEALYDQNLQRSGCVCVCAAPSFKGGMLNRPLLLYPMATALPSLPRSAVQLSPTDIIARIVANLI